jgi:hypothetical protein
VLASLWEAALRAMTVADWMQDTWQWQGKKLRALLEEYSALAA